MDENQQAYLYELAGKAGVRPRRRAAQRVRPAMQRLLDQLIEAPAMVLGCHLDILAWNSWAAALYTGFAQIPAGPRSYVRLLFTDPRVRSLHADRQDAARTSVASLRMEAARCPNDPDLAALVGEMSLPDPDFAHGGPPPSRERQPRHQALPSPARRPHARR
jgi:hypothetical protein